MSTTMTITVVALIAIGIIGVVYFIIGLGIKNYFNQEQSTTKNSNITNFSKVDFKSIGELKITQSNKDGLRVQTSEKYLSRVLDSSQDSTLLLREKEDALYNLFAWALPKPVYHVNVRDIESLSIAGIGGVDIKELTTSNLTIDAKGTGNFTANLDISDELKATISGNRKVVLRGTAQSQIVNVTGNSKYDGYNFVTQTATVNTGGNGNVHVYAKKSLDVTIDGNGKVSYSGDPQISRKGNAATRLHPAE